MNKRISLSLPDALTCELMRLAVKRHLKLAVLCRVMLQESLSPHLIVSSAGVMEAAKSCESLPVAAPAASQGVVTAPTVVAPSRAGAALDTTPEERAAYAARLAESDRKRRVLIAAMGITHPDDAPLPAKFFPGEVDFAAAHPELAI